MKGYVAGARDGNQEAVSQLRYLAARLTNGPGVLTDSDLKNAGVNQAVVDRFKAWVSTGAAGELTEDEIAAFDRIGKAASKRARLNIENVQKNYGSIMDEYNIDSRIVYSGQRELPDETPNPKKEVVKKQYSQSRDQTRIIYSDGAVEVVDGKQ